ncbi:MAG: hypothetical protein LAO21_15110 [Acidobacteriia bacterium]|nr:hypothetical protein [Terriglobia bacterium]
MSSEARSQAAQFERIFSPRSPWEYAAFCILTFALNKVSNRFPDWADAIFGSLLVLIFILMWWSERHRTRARSQRLTFQVTKEPPARAKGLILLVSPYDPRSQNLRDEKVLLPLMDSIRQKQLSVLADADFVEINLSNSNLRPLMDAVAFHSGEDKLREVWLITTESEKRMQEGEEVKIRGSELAGEILEKFLRFKYGERIVVHREGFTVKAWDYAALWRKAEEIFRTSGYKEDVLLADVTGGTKMMSVALAMACVAPNRKMQYMDSGRDWQGNPLPTGMIDPVVIDVDPILYPSHPEIK